MKVLASTLAGLALSQGQDRWTGFDYDYGFGSAERNQISQSSVPNVVVGQGAGQQQNTASPAFTNPSGLLTEAGTLGALFNPYGAAPTFNSASPTTNGGGGPSAASFPTYLGNGMMCWHCDSDSVYSCFNSGQIQICGGQDYFCYFHERRKIGHYFNRREKYIDHHESEATDLFLVRMNNEAWNLDSKHNANSLRNPSTGMTDDHRPATDIHVMAGCQQPQACLRQQMQNQAINIGVAFYGTADKEIGNLNASREDFTTYIHPTSRRNVREGLCRLGKDWTYYSGKLWHYDDGGKYHTDDSGDHGEAGSISLDTIEAVNADPIGFVTVAGHMNPYDSAAYNSANEVEEVFGFTGSGPSDMLWGRGIYDASDLHGHQFWHERESWYNGMRPNGFPDQHSHGGKGTEGVCHFCCNPATSDGMFCNRRLLDNAGSATSPIYTYGTNSTKNSLGMLFSNGAGQWMLYDNNPDIYVTAGASDERNRFVDPDLRRADDPNLKIKESPMVNSYDTGAKWLSEHRYHGMFRNPETQVSQEFLDPYIT